MLISRDPHRILDDFIEKLALFCCMSEKKQRHMHPFCWCLCICVCAIKTQVDNRFRGNFLIHNMFFRSFYFTVK